MLPFVSLSYGEDQIIIKGPKWTKLNHGGINWTKIMNQMDQSGLKYSKVEKVDKLIIKGCFSLLPTPNFLMCQNLEKYQSPELASGHPKK